MKDHNFAYGTDEELLTGSGKFETHEEAFKEAVLERDAEVGDIVYVARMAKWQPKVSASQVIEALNERAWDRCGECVDAWPELNKEQEQILEEKLNELVYSYLQEIGENQRFNTCYDTQSFKVTEKHLEGIK